VGQTRSDALVRLVRLFLQAFGPFTDTVLEFGDGVPNLHLIYGANEAGKSSALRAMLDLRFGIPARSPDDFIHPYKDMRLAGEFIDGEGESVGLVRRKGSGNTLRRFDLVSSPVQETGDALAQYSRALTGGLSREEFELMFGLDHQRLREGGKNLIQGEGELGAALFEASAGMSGTKNVRAALDAQAKEIFTPNKRANSKLKIARATLDDAARARQAAQTRPHEWTVLNRALAQAQEELDSVGATLTNLRRRSDELNQLRGVCPQFVRLDNVVAALEASAHTPTLAPDSRERRLMAEQALERAQVDQAQARRALERCRTALEAVREDRVAIKHAGFIERLFAGIENVGRSRLEWRQCQATVQSDETQLVSAAKRLAPGRSIAQLVDALPTPAERVTLLKNLNEVSTLRARCQSLQEMLAPDHEIASAPDEPDSKLLTPTLRGELDRALKLAQKLGDVQGQLLDFDGGIEEALASVRQRLAELGAPSGDALRRARPMLDDELTKASQHWGALRQRVDTLQSEHRAHEKTLAEHQRRHREIASTGEVVGEQRLLSARERRDSVWTAIRDAYVENSSGFDLRGSRVGASAGGRARTSGPGQSETGQSESVQSESVQGQLPFASDALRPDVFERAVAEADRLADLRWGDVKRLATLAEIEASVTTSELELQSTHDQLEQAVDEERVFALEWHTRVHEAQLPALEPGALTQWQDKRVIALSADETHRKLVAERGRLRATSEAVHATLRAALVAMLGPDSEALEMPASFSELTAHGADLVTRVTADAATAVERAKARHAREQQAHAARRTLAQARDVLQAYESALAPWLPRLFLVGELEPDVLRARLDELDQFVQHERRLQQVRASASKHQATMSEYTEQSSQLGRLLEVAVGESPEDFAETMRQRLDIARKSDNERTIIGRERTAAQETLRAGAEQQTFQEAILNELCAVAGVMSVADLPAFEQAAQQVRQLDAERTQLREQIASASSYSEEQLRERLIDLDVRAIEAALEQGAGDIDACEAQHGAAREAVRVARQALDAVDGSDAAAAALEEELAAAAKIRSLVRPWARLRLGHALLERAMVEFRERAQGPMMSSASRYFESMTGGRYVRLLNDDEGKVPTLIARSADGRDIGLDALSEGTADQLYLALRLAALELRRSSHPGLPLVLDDVLITSDDARTQRIIGALSAFAAGTQVMVFTHHEHIVDLAQDCVGEEALRVHKL
jgi:exonuclease SbcC